MSAYILAHDLGTSGNKAVLYDESGKLIASVLRGYNVSHPAPGFVEQNPEDWWNAVCGATKELLARTEISTADIACCCFSGQMMGCLPVDKNGEPLYPSIIWADMRAVKQAEKMQNLIGMENAYRITGHRIGASYSASKLLWLRDNRPDIFARTYKMLQAKDYIIYRLTGAFVTDYSDAGGTNLFDLNQKCWSEPILRELGITSSMLPDIHASTGIAGKVSAAAASATGLLEGTPVVIGGGDGSCACVGAGVVDQGKTYNVIGSSSWISMAAREPLYDPAMRTFNWVHLDCELYTPCGTMQSAGYSVKWARDVLCAPETGYDLISAQAAASTPGAGGLLFLPHLMGERSPYWNPNARGCFIGMTVNTAKCDMLRAVFEGVGYALKAILDILENSAEIPEITVIGGGAQDSLWMQILADIWQKKLMIPQELEEATSMGAACCGGVGIGLFDDFRAVSRFLNSGSEVLPCPENAVLYERLYALWERCYKALDDAGIYTGLSTLNG